MPPSTSWSPVPHIYFLTWKTGGKKQIHCLRFRGSKPTLHWHLVLCVVLYLFDVNLCRTRRQHEENHSIWGSLCLGSRGGGGGSVGGGKGAGFTHPLLPWSVNREPLPLLPPTPPLPPLVCHVSLFTEKKYSSPFSPVHPETHQPVPVYSYLSHQFPYPIHFHLKSTVLYIYYDYTRFFLLWMFLCCTPSYLVVYWLLSCGMFVLSQSNVVFTLKPHFS